ncbi:MAG: hypothetical protein R2704_05650 [Microthrixaceae bacterium]
MAAYCVVSGIDYLVEECPMAAGNRHLAYKEALTDIETRSPGSKLRPLSRVPGQGRRPLRRRRDHRERRAGHLRAVRLALESDVCAFCRLVERASTAQPVELTRSPKTTS